MTDSAIAYPRPPSEREAEILRFMLSVDDVRLAPLRDKATSAVVTGLCGCGCASVNLAVDRQRWAPASLCSPCVSTTIRVVHGSKAYGLHLFLDEGWLSSLEIWWINEPPPEFPPAADFLPPTLDC